MRRSTHALDSRTAACWLALLALPVVALSACGGQVADSPDPVAMSAAPVIDDALAVPSTLPLAIEEVAPMPQLDPSSLVAATPARTFSATLDIIVRHGETLVVLADQAGCTAEDLAELNGFDVTHMLRAGDSILVPVDAVAADTLLQRRDDSLARRLDRYLRGRGGIAGVSTHRVRTGETGWGIARDVLSVPMWVLAAYNPEVDLDRLSIGDSLQVPVLLDMVADLGPPPEPSADVEDALGLDEELALEEEFEAALLEHSIRAAGTLAEPGPLP